MIPSFYILFAKIQKIFKKDGNYNLFNIYAPHTGAMGRSTFNRRGEPLRWVI